MLTTKRKRLRDGRIFWQTDCNEGSFYASSDGRWTEKADKRSQRSLCLFLFPSRFLVDKFESTIDPDRRAFTPGFVIGSVKMSTLQRLQSKRFTLPHRYGHLETGCGLCTGNAHGHLRLVPASRSDIQKGSYVDANVLQSGVFFQIKVEENLHLTVPLDPFPTSFMERSNI